MRMIIQQGRVLYGIAIIVFGVENLICAPLVLTVRGVPWFPSNPILGYITGLVLIAAGLSIVSNIRARETSIFLGLLFLVYVVFLEAPRVAAEPMDLGVRTVFFETLCMASSALMLARTLSTGGSTLRGRGILDRLISAGPYLFGVSLVVFGTTHFLILNFIASLVPAWLPWKLFWAYLTGAAFIAAGITILIRWLDQWGAFMIGLMFLLWFLILHSPRVVMAFRLHNPNSPDEWSSAFIALAMCGGSWICALQIQQRRGEIA